MSTLMFTAIVFVATFMAALLGFMLQRLVPNRDLDDRSQGNAKLLFGSLSMLTTIVLGFVISDGKTSFDKASRLVADTAVRFVQIDRALADFGPAAAQVRSDMKRSAQEWIAYAHSPSGTVTVLEAIQGGERLDDVFDEIKTLEPTSEALARQQAQATELAAVIRHNRWLMISEDLASTPNAFLIIMLACLMLEFFNFGLFAKRNELITGLTLITALVKAGSIFVILDLQGPTTGLIRVPTELLERAVAAMGH